MCKIKNVPLSYMIHEVYKLFHQSVKKEADLLGINPTYRFVFMALHDSKEGLTQSEICDIVHHKKSSISLLLQEMENEQLISREKSKTDSRQTIVKLTQKGYELDLKLKEVFARCEQKMYSNLSNEEVTQVKLSLDKIIDSLGGEGNV